MATFLGGCGTTQGVLSGIQPKESPGASQAVAVSFRYAPPNATYRYVQLTITNPGDPNAHTTELHFSVKTAKRADRYTAESRIDKALVDGEPRRGVTARDLKAFKLTSVLNSHGGIESARGQSTTRFVGPSAKDLGTSFELPSQPLKPGDSWRRERGSGPDAYTVNFKFVGIQVNGARRVATFEERASSKKGEKVEQPTIISIDADTGVLLDKVAVTTIPIGPEATDIPVRSEIKLVAGG